MVISVTMERAVMASRRRNDEKAILFSTSLEVPDTNTVEVGDVETDPGVDEPEMIGCKVCNAFTAIEAMECCHCGESLESAIRLNDGATWYGALDEDNQITGFGVVIWPNGYRFEGDHQNGRRNGQGVFTWADGFRIEGEWIEGVLQSREMMTRRIFDEHAKALPRLDRCFFNRKVPGLDSDTGSFLGKVEKFTETYRSTFDDPNYDFDPETEESLLFYDESFWGGGSKGILFTETGIRARGALKGDRKAIGIRYDRISSVTLQNLHEVPNDLHVYIGYDSESASVTLKLTYASRPDLEILQNILTKVLDIWGANGEEQPAGDLQDWAEAGDDKDRNRRILSVYIKDRISCYGLRFFLFDESQESTVRKRVRNFLAAYKNDQVDQSALDELGSEQAILLYDDTIFGSGKAGVLFTEEGVLARGVVSGPSKKKVDGIRYDDSGSVNAVGQHIVIERLNGNDPFDVELTLATRKDCEILAEALNRIIGGRAQAPGDSGDGVE
jgi:hypothetical protein